MSNLEFKKFKETMREFSQRYSSLAEEDVFVLWFLRAYITKNAEEAAGAIVGGAGDKSIDAILIDDKAKSVFVVQGKYRKALSAKTEPRSDLIAFAEVAHHLSEHSDAGFAQYVNSMEELTAARADAARKRILSENFRLHQFYVTLGKVSKSLRVDTAALVRRTKCEASCEIIDGKRIMVIHRDYLDGVAPPVPTLDLIMENEPDVRVSGIGNRYDESNDIESWVFSMRGDEVGALFEDAGVRLFARNIRGFLGVKTPVNVGMLRTLEHEPDRFFYYNNGVTIICDEAERKTTRGRDLLQVSNPQVINGQQTTRALAASMRQASKASVLVKVIRVPREGTSSNSEYDALVSQIVAGTNWQNAIKPSDLMSNDRRQIELERALRKRGYLYLRKRQTKGEARAHGGGKRYRLVKKEEFGQAVAGCDLDPVIIRSGLEGLFGEERYQSVFPNSDPDYYLPRYWLMREVTFSAHGVPARGYAKWMVLNFVWGRLSPLLRKKRMARAFVKACEKPQQDSVVVPLNYAIDTIFGEALRYYRKNRGVGDAQLDISLFFKNRKNHHKMFAKHWSATLAKRRTRVANYLKQVQSGLESLAD